MGSIPISSSSESPAAATVAGLFAAMPQVSTRAIRPVQGGGTMATTAEQVAKMVDMLPDNEKEFALELMKRLVLAWDPQFSKVTPEEAADIEAGLLEIERGDTIRHEAIDWD